MPQRKAIAKKTYDFSRLSKDSDEFCAILFRKMSNPITKFLVLHTNVTPNQVSVSSFFMVLIASLFFAMGGYTNMLFGAFFILIYALLDHVDGGIARMKGMGSKKGKWFDSVIGFVTIPMPMFAIAYGMNSLFAMTVCALAIIAYPMQYLIMHFYKLEITGENKPMPVSASGKLDIFKKCYGSMLFFMILIIVSIINRPLWLLLFYATIGNMVWIFTLFLQYRNLK